MLHGLIVAFRKWKIALHEGRRNKENTEINNLNLQYTHNIVGIDTLSYHLLRDILEVKSDKTGINCVEQQSSKETKICPNKI
jgi:hypothetical protein